MIDLTIISTSSQGSAAHYANALLKVHLDMVKLKFIALCSSIAKNFAPKGLMNQYKEEEFTF